MDSICNLNKHHHSLANKAHKELVRLFIVVEVEDFRHGCTFGDSLDRVRHCPLSITALLKKKPLKSVKKPTCFLLLTITAENGLAVGFVIIRELASYADYGANIRSYGKNSWSLIKIALLHSNQKVPSKHLMNALRARVWQRLKPKINLSVFQSEPQ